MKKLYLAALAAITLSSLALAPIATAASANGYASYYMTGKRTANGERFNPMGLTAAHRSLPFGTKIKVTNTRNGRSVVVRVNDRGPFVRGRVIDLSLGAARVVGLTQSGVAKVQLLVLN
jgi:rare lipoprotein A